MDKEYKGAEWVRVDLHLHSPASETFQLPSGVDLVRDKDELVDKYVKRLKEEGIKIGAIVDYQVIREGWFNEIKDRAKKEDITIFPGVELSISSVGGKYGIHLLCIFDQDIDLSGVNRFIHSLDKTPQKSLVKKDRKHRNLEAKYELEKTIQEIRNNYNCLIIFAHPEEDKGIYSSFSPQQVGKYLLSIKPDAIEYLSEESKNKLISTGKISKEFIESIPIIEGSDSKSFEEIGRKERDGKIRTTYFKLSSFTLNALKLALGDHKIRVSLYKKPEMIHNRIKKVSIKGTTFLKDIEINLTPELNTFIGGRGVGKSAIIESIRYALDLPIYAEESYKLDFVSTVVGSGGKIVVEIERFYGKERRRFVVERIVGQNPEVFSNLEKIPISPQEIFESQNTPIVIGQKELYYVAMDKEFLRRLIDDLIGVEVLDKQKEVEEIKEKLKRNGEKILKMRETLRKKDEYEQELKTIEAQIKIYEELGVVEKYRKYMDILEDNEKIAYAKEVFENVMRDFNDNLRKTKDTLSETVVNLKEGKSKGKKFLYKLSEVFEDFKEKIEKIEEDIKNFVISASERMKSIVEEWKRIRLTIEKDIEEVRRKLGEEKLQPDKLEKLTRQKAKIEPIIRELEKYEGELQKLEKERENLKTMLKGTRYQLFEVRKNAIEKINEQLRGRLKIEIKYEKAIKGDFKEGFEMLLKGSNVHQRAIEVILNTPEITIDGLFLSEIIKKGPQELKEKFPDLTEKMAEKVCEWFKNEKFLFELEILLPEDLIDIQLYVDGKLEPLDRLSAGQRATALLLLLFTQQNRILILDQPEEDLDNRFIYEDVVQILRELKSKRQLIIATHNANIPVIGDSELIIVLESHNEKCKIVEEGSIDKDYIKEFVKKIMEGGEEAFRRRAEKYGGIL
jgi:DNA repair ATPase RecN